MKRSFFQAAVVSILLYGCTTWTLTEKKLTEEEARRQLHKNVACNIEQVLASTPYKAPTIWPPASHHENYPGHCWRSKDELISDVLLWTPTYGQVKAGRPARTYIQQLCEDTDVALKTRQRWWMIGRSGERGSGISVLAARHDDEWWWWCVQKWILY